MIRKIVGIFIIAILLSSLSSAQAAFEQSGNTIIVRGKLNSEDAVNIDSGSLAFDNNGNTVSFTPNAGTMVLDGPLEVENQVIIRGGNPADGRVFRAATDNGLGVWEDIVFDVLSDFNDGGDPSAPNDRSIGNLTPLAMTVLVDNNSRLEVDALGASIINAAQLDSDFIVNGQANDNLFFVDASADRIGFGTDTPETKLHVDGGTDANPVFGGFVTFGAPGGVNLVIDDDEILARNAGVSDTLILQDNFGTVRVGDNAGNGRVGVAANPTTSFDVNGILRYRTGAQPGFVLLSFDATGRAIWAPQPLVQGPQGPDGNKGPDGAKGIDGPPGDFGDPGPAGSAENCETVTASGSAFCPPGSTLVGGGGTCSINDRMVESRPNLAGNAWFVRCQDDNNLDQFKNGSARAMCCGNV